MKSNQREGNDNVICATKLQVARDSIRTQYQKIPLCMPQIYLALS